MDQKAKRVAVVIDHLRGDGTQRRLLLLSREFRSRGIDIDIICLRNSSTAMIVSQLRQIGCGVMFIGKWQLATGVGFLRLWSLLKGQYDAVLCLLFYSQIIGGLTAKLARIRKIVFGIAAGNQDYSVIKRALASFSHRLCSDMVVNSYSLVENVEQTVKGGSNILHVILGFAKCQKASLLSRQELLTRFDLPLDAWIVVSIGRLAIQKRYDRALLALEGSRITHFQYLIIGDGPEKQKLKRLVNKLGLERQVHFLGYHEDAYRFLGGADCFLMTSDFEGMSNALLEACQVGCPIVCTKVEGVAELEEARSGEMFHAVSVGDIAGLAQGLSCFAKKKSQAGASDSVRVKPVTHDVNKIIDKWMQVLLN